MRPGSTRISPAGSTSSPTAETTPKKPSSSAASLRRRNARPKTVLELGSGGGNNASHMKAHFELTLTDLSPDMLDLSRTINPELEHIQGDMRTLRLGREFDAVFVHDAVVYMTTEEDLKRGDRDRLRPHSAAAAPPCSRRTRSARTFAPYDGQRRTRRRRRPRPPLPRVELRPRPDRRHLHRRLRLPTPRGRRFRARRPRPPHDGLFSRDTWLRLLARPASRPESVPFDHSELDPGSYEVFIAVKK